jgi:hypothetical protein
MGGNVTSIAGYLVAGESSWRIPAYAQYMLWMQQEEHAGRTAGERGQFLLDVPGDGNKALYVVWGTAGGPPLTIWYKPDTEAPFVVGWQGSVAVGGFIERLHVLEAFGLELVIAEIEGSLLLPNYRRLPTLIQMQQTPFRRTAEDEQSPSPNFTYTFLAMADSVCAEYLHHAMVSELAVNCFATLGPHEGHWHEIVGLPLLIDTVSLLAPGIHGG